jgi:transcriptional regulator with XRE-family HTH domain
LWDNIGISTQAEDGGMASVKDWLNQKFRDWEKEQGKAQSYYAFARFMGVSQTALSTWMSGAAEPSRDEVNLISAKLGQEIYTLTGTQPLNPNKVDQVVEALKVIPAGLRDHLSDAVLEVAQTIRDRELASDSLEAKRVAVEIFTRRGIRLTN